MLGQLLAQQRQNHFVSGDEDGIDLLFAHKLIQRIDYFLGMAQVGVLTAALIARL